MSGTTESKTETRAITTSTRSRLFKLTLGMWGCYFVAKVALYWMGLIGIHAWANLAFAAFILIPVRHALGRRVKQLVAIMLAVALLYYDSWLPAIGRVWSQASVVSDFSATYLLELAGRFISFPVVAMLVAISPLYWLMSRWIRLDGVVIAVLLALPLIALFQSFTPRTIEQQEQYTDEESDWYAQPAPPNEPALAESATSAVQGTQSPQTKHPMPSALSVKLKPSVLSGAKQ